MPLLAVDTSGPQCAAALRFEDGGCVTRIEHISRGHDARLAPMVGELLRDEGLDVADLKKLAVCVGPGSFAGLRVGVAFARGFGLASGAPAVGVGALDVFSRAALDAFDHDARSAMGVGIYDAKRGEVVWSARLHNGHITAPRRMSIEQTAVELCDLAENAELRLAGSGAALINVPGLIDVGIRDVDITLLADLGADRRPDEFPATIFYHRPPDAKPPKAPDLRVTP